MNKLHNEISGGILGALEKASQALLEVDSYSHVLKQAAVLRLPTLTAGSELEQDAISAIAFSETLPDVLVPGTAHIYLRMQEFMKECKRAWESALELFENPPKVPEPEEVSVDGIVGPDAPREEKPLVPEEIIHHKPGSQEVVLYICEEDVYFSVDHFLAQCRFSSEDTRMYKQRAEYCFRAFMEIDGEAAMVIPYAGAKPFLDQVTATNGNKRRVDTYKTTILHYMTNEVERLTAVEEEPVEEPVQETETLPTEEQAPDVQELLASAAEATVVSEDDLDQGSDDRIVVNRRIPLGGRSIGVGFCKDGTAVVNPASLLSFFNVPSRISVRLIREPEFARIKMVDLPDVCGIIHSHHTIPAEDIALVVQEFQRLVAEDAQELAVEGEIEATVVTPPTPVVEAPEPEPAPVAVAETAPSDNHQLLYRALKNLPEGSPDKWSNSVGLLALIWTVLDSSVWEVMEDGFHVRMNTKVPATDGMFEHIRQNWHHLIWKDGEGKGPLKVYPNGNISYQDSINQARQKLMKCGFMLRQPQVKEANPEWRRLQYWYFTMAQYEDLRDAAIYIAAERDMILPEYFHTGLRTVEPVVEEPAEETAVGQPFTAHKGFDAVFSQVADMTIKDLADKSGVRERQLIMFMRGEVHLAVVQKHKIAEALEVPYEEIWGERNSESEGPSERVTVRKHLGDRRGGNIS